MAGKGPAIAPRGVFYALDDLSKNTLIDLVADIAIGEVGEATPETILAWIQKRIEPIHRARKQCPVDLVGALAKLAASDARYRATQVVKPTAGERAMAKAATSKYTDKPVWEA
ncbi:MAG: hypothetical protein ACREA9_17450 [Pyrinomonadaceae bacterium]